jgi:hypothetical protein
MTGLIQIRNDCQRLNRRQNALAVMLGLARLEAIRAGQ